MIPNIRPSVVYPIAGAIAPQSVAAAASVNTGWVKVAPGSKWAIAQLLAGALGGGSVQVDVLQAQDGAGTGSKAAVTNLFTNATNNTQTDGEINVETTLDINNGFSYVQVKATNTGGTGALISVGLRFGPNEFAA